MFVQYLLSIVLCQRGRKLMTMNNDRCNKLSTNMLPPVITFAMLIMLMDSRHFVADSHLLTWGSITGGDGVKTEFHVLRKGQ